MVKIMRKLLATNPEVHGLVQFLKEAAFKNEAPIWKDVAKRMAKPSRRRAEVNISKINRYASENDTIVVAGKVLGAGSLKQNVTVAAFNFSNTAKLAIEAAGGKCITIPELVEQNPKGSKVVIMA
jgi:large subunit ribosomal protein L18e